MRAVCCLIAAVLLHSPLHAQLIGEPPIPPRAPKQDKPGKVRQVRPIDPEWMWQYSPPPADGREHELIQDPEFLPFVAQNLSAPQSFWQAPTGERKRLPEVVYDFLAIPGKVVADDNRYLSVSGAVFRRRTDRGLLFVDLNAPAGKHSREDREQLPYVVFAAVAWDRESKTTDEPDAPHTLWIFPSRAPTPGAAMLSEAATHALVRWLHEPIPGLGEPSHLSAAIEVDPDGTPHQIPIPADATVGDQAPTLAPRH